MEPENIIRYIKERSKKGFSRGFIEEQLREKGVSETEIERAFYESEIYKDNFITKLFGILFFPKKVFSMIAHEEIKKSYKYYRIIRILILFVLSVFVFYGFRTEVPEFIDFSNRIIINLELPMEFISYSWLGISFILAILFAIIMIIMPVITYSVAKIFYGTILLFNIKSLFNNNYKIFLYSFTPFFISLPISIIFFIIGKIDLKEGFILASGIILLASILWSIILLIVGVYEINSCSLIKSVGAICLFILFIGTVFVASYYFSKYIFDKIISANAQ